MQCSLQILRGHGPYRSRAARAKAGSARPNLDIAIGNMADIEHPIVIAM
jgi:hypothetical protein